MSLWGKAASKLHPLLGAAKVDSKKIKILEQQRIISKIKYLISKGLPSAKVSVGRAAHNAVTRNKTRQAASTYRGETARILNSVRGELRKRQTIVAKGLGHGGVGFDLQSQFIPKNAWARMPKFFQTKMGVPTDKNRLREFLRQVRQNIFAPPIFKKRPVVQVSGDPRPGFLAHELGHALGPLGKKSVSTYGKVELLSRMIPTWPVPLASVAATRGEKKNKKKISKEKAAVLTALPFLLKAPMLGEEAMASIRAVRILAKSKVSLRHALPLIPAFGTYAFGPTVATMLTRWRINSVNKRAKGGPKDPERSRAAKRRQRRKGKFA